MVGDLYLNSFLLNKIIDVLLYVDRLDAYRVDNLDKEVVRAITNSFGKRIWNRALEYVILNGIAWISYLVEKITEVALNGSKSIFVDTKLIEGPNPNERGKTFIPLILLIQFFFAIKPIERAIKTDIARESRPAWEMRDASLFSRKF
ncbi:translocase of chloroplast 34, chloroplastic-like [Morus notabilis]|uniref:translocase of chloroplast 34, chloroplastic-like n=1 Tax=Morus notabilis TaxID=981085 RepID=UPI000CED3CE4|nr:translocase of chloroplast 34, chloroplastic-like [Morus notabilis]